MLIDIYSFSVFMFTTRESSCFVDDESLVYIHFIHILRYVKGFRPFFFLKKRCLEAYSKHANRLIYLRFLRLLTSLRFRDGNIWGQYELYKSKETNDEITPFDLCL